tara:strand:- start:153 stop:1667 length:1515 start_codon:yes stop_codon:yes gene_type:complete
MRALLMLTSLSVAASAMLGGGRQRKDLASAARASHAKATQAAAYSVTTTNLGATQAAAAAAASAPPPEANVAGVGSNANPFAYQYKETIAVVPTDDPKPAALLQLHLKNLMDTDQDGWNLRLSHICSAEEVAQDVVSNPNQLGVGFGAGYDVGGISSLLDAGKVYSIVFLVEKVYSSTVFIHAVPNAIPVTEMRNVTIWSRDAPPQFAQTLHAHHVPRRPARSCTGNIVNGVPDASLLAGCPATMAAAAAAAAVAVPISDPLIAPWASKGNVAVIAAEQASDVVDFEDLWDERSSDWLQLPSSAGKAKSRVAISNFFLLKFSAPGSAGVEKWLVTMCSSPAAVASTATAPDPFTLCSSYRVGADSASPAPAGGAGIVAKTKAAVSSGISSLASVFTGSSKSTPAPAPLNANTPKQLQDAQRMLRLSRSGGGANAAGGSTYAGFFWLLVKLGVVVGAVVGTVLLARKYCATVGGRTPLAAAAWAAPRRSTNSGFINAQPSSYGSG